MSSLILYEVSGRIATQANDSNRKRKEGPITVQIMDTLFSGTRVALVSSVVVGNGRAKIEHERVLICRRCSLVGANPPPKRSHINLFRNNKSLQDVPLG